MARRTRRKHVILGGVAIAVLVAVSWIVRPLQETLLSRSTIHVLPRGHLAYGWLGPDTVIAFGTDARGRTDAQAVSLNAKAITPILPLDALLTANLRVDPVQALVSPDGKWALWSGAGPRGPTWNAARIDGAKSVAWPRANTVANSSRGTVCWMPDSRHWVDIDTKNGFLVVTRRDVAAPATFSSTSVKAAYGGTVIGSLADGRALAVINDRWVGGPALHLAAIDLVHPASPASMSAIQLPAGLEVDEITLSPQGDRLAWKLRDKRSTDYSTMGQLKWRVGMVPRARYSLRLSRLDGSDMREVGMLESPGNQLGFNQIRWAPDGRKVAFLHEGKLYVVSAE